MMHGSKSGKTWATLVRKLADGKQKIVCNCPITEQMRVQGNSIQNLSGVYQNLYMQQKLAELSEQVQDVYDAVFRIEQGQMDDRIGKLISGHNDAMRALENPKSEARERELELARSKISEAQSQIGQVFKSRIEDFKPIPESKIARRVKEILSPSTSYMKKCDEEFNKLQEYFEFYLRATQLLAWSHSIVGDTDRAKIVFEQSIGANISKESNESLIIWFMQACIVALTSTLVTICVWRIFAKREFRAIMTKVIGRTKR